MHKTGTPWPVATIVSYILGSGANSMPHPTHCSNVSSTRSVSWVVTACLAFRSGCRGSLHVP